MDQIEFLGMPVHNGSIQDVLQWMEGCIASRKAQRIAVVNANKFWLMSREKRLTNYVRSSGLVIPEWAVVWGAARLGTPLRSHIRGVGLLQAAIPWAEQHGYRIFFLGASPEVSALLTENLRYTHPKLQLAGCHHGYLQSEEIKLHVLQEIKNSAADVLFVAMGSPKQEYWIEENLARINVPVAMGVGGSFDVLAGIKKDAPGWVQGRGLEWIYRTLQDPKTYLKRYLIVNTWFVLQVVKASFSQRRSAK